jgi:hypothetical protein
MLIQIIKLSVWYPKLMTHLSFHCPDIFVDKLFFYHFLISLSKRRRVHPYRLACKVTLCILVFGFSGSRRIDDKYARGNDCVADDGDDKNNKQQQ